MRQLSRWMKLVGALYVFNGIATLLMSPLLVATLSPMLVQQPSRTGGRRASATSVEP